MKITEMILDEIRAEFGQRLGFLELQEEQTRKRMKQLEARISAAMKRSGDRFGKLLSSVQSLEARTSDAPTGDDFEDLDGRVAGVEIRVARLLPNAEAIPREEVLEEFFEKVKGALNQRRHRLQSADLDELREIDGRTVDTIGRIVGLTEMELKHE